MWYLQRMATENLFAIRTFIFAYPMLDKEQMTCYNGADMTGNGEWSMKRYRVAALLTAVLCAILLFGCAGGKIADDRETQKTSYQQVSQDEAMTMMANERDYIILDVRTQEEYAEKHIPGAICIPNETIGDAPVPELPDRDQLILIYCRSGNRSKQAAQKLFDQGYTRIVEFGGINTWQGETVSGAETDAEASK